MFTILLTLRYIKDILIKIWKIIYSTLIFIKLIFQILMYWLIIFWFVLLYKYWILQNIYNVLIWNL